MKTLTAQYFESRLSLLKKVTDRLLKSHPPPDFVTTPHNKSFILKSSFRRGYLIAVNNIGRDYRIPWRVHQAQ